MKCEALTISEYFHNLGPLLEDWTLPAYPIAERVSYTCPFDRVIVSPDRKYAFLYQALGTKGVILRKDGKVFREMNRSFYHSKVYEYPAVFWKRKDGKTYLIHCPQEYNRLEIQNVETGEILSDIPGRKPEDAFHSRLLIGPDNRTLLSRGWYWHPWDFVEAFDLEECCKNPKLLDRSTWTPKVQKEIHGASFIDANHVLLGFSLESSETGEETPEELLSLWRIAVWNIRTNTVSEPLPTGVEVGSHLIAINENFAWDLCGYPKIIDIKTGRVTDSCEINSGNQRSSIIWHKENIPRIAYNTSTKQIAIGRGESIDILTPDYER